MKEPGQCTSIEDIRHAIDAIDRQVIDLLGKRLEYVKAIVRFKKDEEDIIARKRYAEVLLARREWAKEWDLDPDVIENVYKSLIHHFIEVQKKALHRKHNLKKQQ